MALMKFQNGSCHWVAGPTGSGKSCLIKKLIAHRTEMFEEAPVEIYYCYKIYQPKLFNEMAEKDDVIFFEGLPTIDTLKEWGRSTGGRHGLVIFDDLQHELLSSKDHVNVFSVLAHHLNLSVMCLVQNIFPRMRWSKDVALQCTYLFLMRNRRDLNQISVLGSQLCGKGKCSFFTDSYQDAVNSCPYGFLLVDLNGSTPSDLMLRTQIWPDQTTVVYKPARK